LEEANLRKLLILIIVMSGVASSPALASWGCFAKSSTHTWRVWGYENRSAAVQAILANCKTGNDGACSVTTCNDHTSDEPSAMAQWPLPNGAHLDSCFGSGCK
jgi:hypothetical protein